MTVTWIWTSWTLAHEQTRTRAHKHTRTGAWHKHTSTWRHKNVSTLAREMIFVRVCITVPWQKWETFRSSWRGNKQTALCLSSLSDPGWSRLVSLCMHFASTVKLMKKPHQRLDSLYKFFQVFERQRYDPGCDWWSLGVILNNMLTSKVCLRSCDFRS